MDQKVKISQLPEAATADNVEVVGYNTVTKQTVRVGKEKLKESGTIKSEEYSSKNYAEI